MLTTVGAANDVTLGGATCPLATAAALLGGGALLSGVALLGGSALLKAGAVVGIGAGGGCIEGNGSAVCDGAAAFRALPPKRELIRDVFSKAVSAGGWSALLYYRIEGLLSTLLQT